MKYTKAALCHKKFITLISVILLLILVSSCKKKCNEYTLGSLTEMNPYTGNETLVFKKSNGEDIVFRGEGRNITINTVQPQNSGEECEKTEFDDCFFKEEDDLFQLNIKLRPTTYVSQSHMFLVLVDYRYNDLRPFDYRVWFNIPLDKDNIAEGQAYYDSLNIQSTTYYDVFTAETDYNLKYSVKQIAMDTIRPSLFYYNSQVGLLKMDFDDGSTWELKEILN
jgi:hypothetical protein